MKAGRSARTAGTCPGGAQEHVVAVSGGGLPGQLFSIVAVTHVSTVTPIYRLVPVGVHAGQAGLDVVAAILGAVDVHGHTERGILRRRGPLTGQDGSQVGP